MMAIVPYLEEYADDFARLVAEFRQFNTDGFSERFRPEIADAECCERIERARTDDSCELFLLLDGSRPVGFLQISVLDHPPFRTPVKERVGSIDTVFVLPSHRGQGWGETLFRMGERRLIERGVSHIDLDVTVFNTVARAWYERMGYEVQHLKMSRSVP
jgi:ribosomal protein S18 acetylase RimI-like enzyme